MKFIGMKNPPIFKGIFLINKAVEDLTDIWENIFEN
jgi:hypothetical protein